jgi:hypothetical protein
VGDGKVERGYISCFTNLPPLVYFFQYNPAEVTIAKRVNYSADGVAGGGKGALGRAGAMQAAPPGFISGLMSDVGNFLSTAEAKRFSREDDRTLRFKLFINGTEPGPREPGDFRDSGHILDDLAILESFLYPSPGNILDVAGQLFGSSGPGWDKIWFAQPPVATVSLGGIGFEGFITDMSIHVTQWNADLDPCRAEVEISVLEKPDSLTSLINHAKRLYRMTAGSIKQIGTAFEED